MLRQYGDTESLVAASASKDSRRHACKCRNALLLHCILLGVLDEAGALWQDGDAESLVAAGASKGGSWMDTILNLIPGRRAAASSEPSEEAIKRTHDTLRCLPPTSLLIVGSWHIQHDALI